MIGRTLSHYQVLSEISRGGTAVVCRTLDLKPDREVSRKVLPPDEGADELRVEVRKKLPDRLWRDPITSWDGGGDR